MLNAHQVSNLKNLICGLDVLAWGSNHKRTLFNQISQEGENHASIWLTIPANKENESLVERYCDGAKQKIPYRKAQRIIGQDNFEVIEILFSVAMNESYLITLRDFDDDELASRKQGAWYYDEDVVKYFNPEKKSSSDSTAYLCPILIDHLSTCEIYNSYVYAKHMIYLIDYKIQQCKKLYEEISKSKAGSKLKPTTFFYANNLLENDLSFNVSHIYTDEDIQVLKNKVKKRLNDLRIDLVDYESKERSLESQENQHMLNTRRTIGNPHDGINHIPLMRGGNKLVDVEKALAKMFDIANGNQSYNLATNNCTTSVAIVLEACLIDTYSQAISAKRNFFGVIYPSLLMDNISRIKININEDQKANLWNDLYKLNPTYWIKYIMSIPVGTVFNPESNFLLKALAVLSIPIIAGPLVLSIIICTPFSMLGYYIFLSNKDNLLKIHSTNIEQGIDLSYDTAEKIEYNRHEKNHKLASNYLNSKIYEIDNENIENAILQYISALYITDSIPCFSSKVKEIILLELSKDPQIADDIVDYILQKINNFKVNNTDTILPPCNIPDLSDKREEFIKNPKSIITELENLSLVKLKDISKILYKKISLNNEELSLSDPDISEKIKHLCSMPDDDTQSGEVELDIKISRDRLKKGR